MTIITPDRLTHDLKALGVSSGMTLMVHASLRRLRAVQGGANAVLDALFSALGSSGTLLMVLGADDRTPFHRLTSPADPDVGMLAECFRTRAETLVNDHAAARFGASGPKAFELLEPIPLHDYFGSGSVLERFVGLGGMVLRLGADPDTVTLTHLAEYLAHMSDKRRVKRRYLRADIGEQWIESLDDSEGIAEWSKGDYFPQILLDYLASARAIIGRVGHCTAEMFSARDFTAYAITWIETNLVSQR
jgi:aminoglycoside N3'-acetyltransferase